MTIINKIIGVIFSLFLVFIFIVKINGLQSVSLKIVALTLLFVAIVVVAIRFYYNKLKINNIYYKILNMINSFSVLRIVCGVFLVSLFVKISCVFLFQIESFSYNSDIMGYMKCANELVNYGEIRTLQTWIYYFPYLFWFSAFITPPIYLFGNSYIAVSIYMCIINSITVALIASTIISQFGKMKSLVVSFALIFLPSQMILPQCYIHEQALLFFLTIALWLYFSVLPRMRKNYSKIIVVCLFCISLLFARMVNGGATIAIIAFTIYSIIKYKNLLRKILIPILAICFVFLSIGSINKIPVNFTNIDPSVTQKEYFSSWKYYVGLNLESKGGFSKTDSETYGWNKYNMNTTNLFGEELTKYRKQLLSNRLKERVRHPSDLVYLACCKFKTIWIDYGFPFGFIDNNKVNTYVNYIFHFTINFEYIFMVLLILLVIINIALNYKKQINEKSINLFFKLFMMGMTSALFLIECNNKYAYVVNIYLIIYSICCIDKITVKKMFCRKFVK